MPTLREPHRLEIHDLEVHHRIYERLGNEVLSYLVVLCRRCHQHSLPRHLAGSRLALSRHS